mmetsp:Transcript_26457/g.81369  ORF Transcript_26457/g.81369 Transcript_26457/m.81369 type:complete len:224 (-) Transcript_26457:526-1197(-)
MGGFLARAAARGAEARAVAQRGAQEVHPQTAARHAAAEVQRLMEESEAAPEMDAAVLEQFRKLAAHKTEAVDPYVNVTPEQRARIRERYDRLHRDSDEPPPGRASERALQRALSWRAHDAEPPVAQVTKDLKVDPTVVRSLLLYVGTPHASRELSSNTKIGTWLDLRENVARNDTGPALRTLLEAGLVEPSSSAAAEAAAASPAFQTKPASALAKKSKFKTGL